jgi:hypothetical protein
MMESLVKMPRYCSAVALRMPTAEQSESTFNSLAVRAATWRMSRRIESAFRTFYDVGDVPVDDGIARS